MEHLMKKAGKASSFLTKHIGIIIICFSVIAFFWPLDYRVSILASFLNFIQIEIAESGFDCEMMIQTYENDKLEQYGTTFLKNGYSGAIIGAYSGKMFGLTVDQYHWHTGADALKPLLVFGRACTDNSAAVAIF